MTREDRARFLRTVDVKARRKRAARERRESVWFGLGMFGLVGWSVALPTLLGIAVGIWLDARADDPKISWTLTGLAVGVTIGCAVAWYWVRQEAERGMQHEDDTEEQDADEAT